MVGGLSHNANRKEKPMYSRPGRGKCAAAYAAHAQSLLEEAEKSPGSGRGSELELELELQPGQEAGPGGNTTHRERERESGSSIHQCALLEFISFNDTLNIYF